MSISCSINTLISEHQQTLELSWLTPPPPLSQAMDPGTDYWMGTYNAEHYHPIELVQRDNLQLLRHALSQETLYLPALLAAKQPGLIIFSDDVTCDPEMRAGLQHHGIAALKSPLPSKSILRALAYPLANHSPHQTMHGVMLCVSGEGVLLTGKSGLGKSAIALELISRGHQLVADDAPLLHRLPDSRQVHAVCPPMLEDFLEVRALGIVNICKLFGPAASTACTPVNLVIELVEHLHMEATRRIQPYSERINILGMDIPYLPIPLGHATNLALLVETVTKNHILYKEGYDASAVLTARQQQLLNKQTV